MTKPVGLRGTRETRACAWPVYNSNIWALVRCVYVVIGIQRMQEVGDRLVGGTMEWSMYPNEMNNDKLNMLIQKKSHVFNILFQCFVQ
jgi:hypothetical protein